MASIPISNSSHAGDLQIPEEEVKPEKVDTTLVVIDSSKSKVSAEDVIKVAFTHVIRTGGKCLYLIGIFTKIPAGLTYIAVDQANPTAVACELSNKKGMLNAVAELLRLDEACEKAGISLSVEVRAGTQIHRIAVEEALRCGATQVVLESAMKRHGDYFRVALNCGVVRVRESGGVEHIRSLSIPPTATNLPPVKITPPPSRSPSPAPCPTPQPVIVAPSPPKYSENPDADALISGSPPFPSAASSTLAPTSPPPPIELPLSPRSRSSTPDHSLPREWILRTPSRRTDSLGRSSTPGSPCFLGSAKQAYQVFISHRGPDVKNGFVGYLDSGFHSRDVQSFLDRKDLGVGEYIWDRLQFVIERVPVGLVIFTTDFAGSPWCLEELHLLLQNPGTQVLPIFYNVKPSDVRQPGRGQLRAGWRRTAGRVSSASLSRWKVALKRASEILGWEYCSNGYMLEADLVNEVVSTVTSKLVKSKLELQERTNEVVQVQQSQVDLHR